MSRVTEDGVDKKNENKQRNPSARKEEELLKRGG